MPKVIFGAEDYLAVWLILIREKEYVFWAHLVIDIVFS